MLDITPAIIAAWSASQFVVSELAKGASTEAGKKLVGELWDKLKEKFKTNDKATKAMLAIKNDGSQDAVDKLAHYIDDEIEDSADFGSTLHELVQNIVNTEQSQQQQKQVSSMATGKGSTAIATGDNINHGSGAINQGNTSVVNNNNYYGKDPH